MTDNVSHRYYKQYPVVFHIFVSHCSTCTCRLLYSIHCVFIVQTVGLCTFVHLVHAQFANLSMEN